MNKLFLIN